MAIVYSSTLSVTGAAYSHSGSDQIIATTTIPVAVLNACSNPYLISAAAGKVTGPSITGPPPSMVAYLTLPGSGTVYETRTTLLGAQARDNGSNVFYLQGRGIEPILAFTGLAAFPFPNDAILELGIQATGDVDTLSYTGLLVFGIYDAADVVPYNRFPFTGDFFQYPPPPSFGVTPIDTTATPYIGAVHSPKGLVGTSTPIHYFYGVSGASPGTPVAPTFEGAPDWLTILSARNGALFAGWAEYVGDYSALPDVGVRVDFGATSFLVGSVVAASNVSSGRSWLALVG